MANLVSAHDFMRTVFPPELTEHTEIPLVAYPATYELDGIQRNYYRQFAWHPRSKILDRPEGWTFCISTVTRQDPVRRRLNDLQHCFVIVCDDIGTKAEPPPVAPSYRLETSPGNEQWGYLIDPFEVTGYHGHAQVDMLLLSLAQAGYNDHGCRGAARVVKLPGALHKSGFITRALEWAPERVWSLADLVIAFDIPMIKPGYGGRRRPTGKPLASIRDPILDWLTEKGLVLGTNDRGWAELRACPWAAEHSKVATGGDYSPLDYGMPGRDFKCLHESCRDRSLLDFIRWVKEQGGPVPDSWGGGA